VITAEPAAQQLRLIDQLSGSPLKYRQSARIVSAMLALAPGHRRETGGWAVEQAVLQTASHRSELAAGRSRRADGANSIGLPRSRWERDRGKLEYKNTRARQPAANPPA